MELRHIVENGIWKGIHTEEEKKEYEDEKRCRRWAMKLVETSGWSEWMWCSMGFIWFYLVWFSLLNGCKSMVGWMYGGLILHLLLTNKNEVWGYSYN